MTFNTGNPVGSTDARDLHDNAANFDIAANSLEDTFQDRLGRSRLTYKGIESAASTGNPAVAAAAQAVSAAQEATDAAARAESALSQVDQAVTGVAEQAAAAATGLANEAAGRAEAAASAAFVNADVYPDIATGLASVTDGKQFQVVSGNEVIRYRRDSATTQTEIARYPSAAINSITVNIGKSFPLAPAIRDGETSGAQPRANSAILDTKIIGARPGKIYRLEFIGNGITSLGSANAYGLIVAEYDEATYATNSASSKTFIINLDDFDFSASPGAGVITRTVRSIRVPSIVFQVTYDTTAINGASLGMNNTGQLAYSWIIHKSQYIELKDSAQVKPVMQYSLSAGGRLSVAYASKTDCYKIDFGPNGANNLPNIISIERSPGANLDSAVWTLINTQSTDWLPPLIIDSAISGAPAERNELTGGNHLVDGVTTARNAIYNVFADGSPVALGGSGFAYSIRVVVVNELMAGNTVSLGRYTARQAFNITFEAESISVDAAVTAIEAVKFKLDYGLQCWTDGFRDSQLFLGGSNTSRGAFDATKNSGTKQQYPNAWAIILHSSNGQLGMWMDKQYALGDGSLVEQTAPLIRGGGETNLKFYLCALSQRVVSAPVTAAGESYRYRGGYSLSSSYPVPAGFDSILPVARGGHMTQAYALSDGNSVII